MRKLAGLCTALFLLVSVNSASAAKRLGPPIEQLLSEPDRIRIVIAEAGEKSGSNGIRFAVTERLSGEAPDFVVIRTDESTLESLQAGQSYIVAWSYLRRNRGVIGGWEQDPEGPATVEVLGLGATALFEDTPDLRFLFSPAATAEVDRAGRQLDALLGQAERADFRSRGLVVTELYLRPDLSAIMTPEQAGILKRVFQAQNLDPQHRDFLYRAALEAPPELTSPWLAEEFRKTIILHGTQYDLSSFVPGLVRTAARGLQQTGTAADIDLLSILLYSNNPGVAKAALAAMNQLDSNATVAKGEQAIARGWIHGDSRRALLKYLAKAAEQP